MGHNAKLHSDGACRADGRSSYAWTIQASVVALENKLIGGRPTCKDQGSILIAYGVDLVEGKCSSILTEAWGIMEAAKQLNVIVDTITQTVNACQGSGREASSSSEINTSRVRSI